MTLIYNSTIPKQYSTYTVNIASFSCPPREATLAARDPYFPPGTPLKIVRKYLPYYLQVDEATIFARHGAIRHGRYVFMRSSTSFGHQRSSAPTTYIYIYIYIYTVISTLECHRTATVGEARAPQVQGSSAMSFLFFVFCFLLTVVLNKD